MKQYATLALLAWLTFNTHEAQAFYNPQTGRWLSRDPLSEKGGINLYAIGNNSVINGVDVLGLDYFIVTQPGFCGVHHRILIGDDGKGGHYSMEIVPVVHHWWQNWRRICGRGVINVIEDLHGNAKDAVEGRGITEKPVATTADFDRRMAAAVLTLDQQRITYCLFRRDCRAVEYCALEATLASEILDKLQNLVDQILRRLTTP